MTDDEARAERLLSLIRQNIHVVNVRLVQEFAADARRAALEEAARCADDFIADCDCATAYGDCDVSEHVARVIRALATRRTTHE